MPYRKRISLATSIYWLLLVYIITALIWWFISLENQNSDMREFKIIQLDASINKQISPDLYNAAYTHIQQEYNTNSAKYIGEGATFLILILIGAVFIYRLVRRQFLFQQQQQNFMMAITHELKTPIAVARLNLETMQKYNLEGERRQKLIRMTLEETERLNILTNNILISSQLEGAGYIMAKDEMDLSDLFKDCVDNFIYRHPDRKFTEYIEPDADIIGDAVLLQLLINNLLENAIKYSPKDKPVHCRLETKNGTVDLHVIDEGAGIANEEKKKIFKKFYRVGTETTRKTQGTGLGLYLCRKIAEDHDGAIVVNDNKPQGSDFTVTFPTMKKN
jgi:two-component system, OmpR family, sensor histidine kinase CiaH